MKDSAVIVSSIPTRVRFDHDGSRLTGVEIVRARRFPAILPRRRVLLALGVVVSSYQVRPRAMELVERIVIERQEGGSVVGVERAEPVA